MQSVDILGDDAAEPPLSLQGDQRLVRGIGLRGDVEELAPHLPRSGADIGRLDVSVEGELTRIVAGPDATGRTKVRHAALGTRPGAAERDDPRRRPKRGYQRFVHHVLPILARATGRTYR